jgi:hypothetical protein
VEPNTEGVLLLKTIYTSQHQCLYWSWTHSCNRSNPLCCLVRTCSAINTCQETWVWMACEMCISEASWHTPSLGWVCAPYPEIFLCDQSKWIEVSTLIYTPSILYLHLWNRLYSTSKLISDTYCSICYVVRQHISNIYQYGMVRQDVLSEHQDLLNRWHSITFQMTEPSITPKNSHFMCYTFILKYGGWPIVTTYITQMTDLQCNM